MANGDVILHNKFKAELAKANIDLELATFRCYLLNGWTPNIDTDHYISDIVSNEISLAGYTAGGVTLANLAVAENDTNDRFEWDFDNPTWASLAVGTVTRAAIVHWTGVAATSAIVANIEIGTNPNGNSFTLTLGANGILFGS